MRSLVILRGAPGAGKSTWIKNNNLENYTLCADTLRLLMESPVMTADENRVTTSQKNDKDVWLLLFELLEKRMSRGEFVVVDATHSRSSDFSRYNTLCERYRYRKYYVDFSDVPMEVCKERNLQREPYKRVPEEVIEKIYARLKTQGKTSGWVEIDKDNFWNEIDVKLFDMNKYDKVHIFGDIHGCLNPLKMYFENHTYSENEMYIFCGDYTDKGLQNKETLEFLMGLSEKRNTLFLEGNHEGWVNYYANDEVENIKSKTFLHKTMPEIIDMDKKELRSFYRKIGQMAYFEFDNKKYFVTHGGLSYMSERLVLVATDQMIHGVGDYNVNIDEVWSKNMKNMVERWEPIKGYVGSYEISSYGRVKSLAREVVCSDGKVVHYKERLLSQSLSTKGYPKVVITKNGKQKCIFIHRIVAETFIPNPNNLPEVNHINENKLDNRVENLEWMTTKENCNYGTRNYRMALHHKKGCVFDKSKPYEKTKPSNCFTKVIEQDIIQVHAHRNTFEIDNVDNKSYDLEGKVEFGGDLKVLQLEHGCEPIMIRVKNDYFGEPEQINEFSECGTKLNMPMVEQLRLSPDIKEKDLGNNISSFNFTRDVFYSRRWNNLTTKARGLFVDTEKDKVVARGYQKFFNINETRDTKLEHLLVKFKDNKITCYKKENGFLGILSYVNGELFFAQKRTNDGEFSGYFKDLFDKSDIDRDRLIEYLKENDVSLTFEVIDVENDPHIIEYDKSKIVLLDIIHNKYEFEREPYEKVVELAESINCKCKSVYKEFDNVRDFHKWYLESTDENDLSKSDIEGVVIECNGIMTKLKFPYYNFWKSMRRLKEQVLHKHNVKLSSLYNATSNYFYAWLKKQPEQILEKDIITLRDMFYESGDYNE